MKAQDLSCRTKGSTTSTSRAHEVLVRHRCAPQNISGAAPIVICSTISSITSGTCAGLLISNGGRPGPPPVSMTSTPNTDSNSGRGAEHASPNAVGWQTIPCPSNHCRQRSIVSADGRLALTVSTSTGRSTYPVGAFRRTSNSTRSTRLFIVPAFAYVGARVHLPPR